MPVPWRRASVWGRLDRVSSRRSGKWTRNSCCISYIHAELVFRGAHQECAHNRNEIRAFPPELVFREIPRKTAQRCRQSQWFRWLFLGTPLLNAVARRVLRVLRTPTRLCLLPSYRLALWLMARALAQSYPRIRTEPVAADGARSLSKRGHRETSSLCPDASTWDQLPAAAMK
jgi:hypothetical protein